MSARFLYGISRVSQAIPVASLNGPIADLGGLYISDTGAHTGAFCGFLATADAVATFVGNVTGATSVAVKAGVFIPGLFSSVTLASGAGIAYNASESLT